MGWPFGFCGNPNNDVLPKLLISSIASMSSIAAASSIESISYYVGLRVILGTVNVKIFVVRIFCGLNF